MVFATVYAPPMKIAIRIVIGLALAVAALLLVLYIALAPPAPLGVPEPGAVLSGVTVINPGHGREANRLVRVEGETIASIASADGTTGEYSGAFVLPGLIDMHAHFPPPSALGNTEHFAFLFLYHGVTTVRHAGDLDGTTTEPARQGVRSGAFPGPRVFACGPFVDGDGSRWPNSRQVREPAEAREVIEAIAEDYDCVKAYNTLTPESAAAVHAAAKEVGIPVIGHVPRGARFDDAHLDDAQHLMGMTGPEGSHGPFPQSMSAWRDLDDERLDEIVRSAVARGIAVTPTLVVIDRLSRMHDHAALSLEFDAQLMPRYFRNVVWRQNPELTDADYVGLRAALARELELIAALHRAGVRIHAGTDVLVSFVVPGASMHRELQLFVDAGLTPEQAWEIATRSNGSFLPTPGLGTVTPGAPADLLVFSEDPTHDLAALDSLLAVVANGRLYTRTELDAHLALRRSHIEGAIFDRVSVEIARRVMARLFDRSKEED